MTQEELKKRLELGDKYREIEAACEQKLMGYIKLYEAKEYYRKTYNLPPGTPLGYAFLKKDPEFDPETFIPGQGGNTDFFFIDINGVLSKPYKDFGLLLNETKNRGSIDPFDWSKEELAIINQNDPIINAKSKRVPITAKDSDIIIGYIKTKK